MPRATALGAGRVEMRSQTVWLRRCSVAPLDAEYPGQISDEKDKNSMLKKLHLIEGWLLI